jgi:hypothetical protein
MNIKYAYPDSINIAYEDLEEFVATYWGENWKVECCHEAVDTGTKKTWCKLCNKTGWFDLGCIHWED